MWVSSCREFDHGSLLSVLCYSEPRSAPDAALPWQRRGSKPHGPGQAATALRPPGAGHGPLPGCDSFGLPVLGATKEPSSSRALRCGLRPH